MIITKTLTNEPLTEEQLEQLEHAKKMPIVYDEDCPKMTPKMEEAFKKAVAERNAKRAK